MELKPCPILVASIRKDGTLCIQHHCAWWCEYAGCCSVPLIAGILADSTICNNLFNQFVINEEPKEVISEKRCVTCLHDDEDKNGTCKFCVWIIEPTDGNTKIPSNWEPKKEIGA